MATNTSSSTSNTSLMFLLPTSECIPWLVVFIIEYLAIVILNIITIIVFLKQRQLQRKSTYLIIHLAIVDLLVGAVSAPLNIYFGDIGRDCGLWKFERISLIKIYVCYVLRYFLPLTSLFNLVVISLERFHAIFRPFRHRVLRKWVYGMCICVIWLAFILCGSADVISMERGVNSLKRHAMHMSYYGICVFVICVSCILVVIKVRHRSLPRHYGATISERKLTITLVLVALASLVSWLPLVIFSLSVIATNREITNQLSWQTESHVRVIVTALSFGNSLLNPIVYALRMPEFRMAVLRLFHKASRGNELDPNHQLRLRQLDHLPIRATGS